MSCAFAISYIFLLLHPSYGINVDSWKIDYLFAEFIADTTPILFPPARTVVQVCSDSDSALRLSRQMSRYSLSHSVQYSFDSRTLSLYDNVEHRNLYAVDLSCDYVVHLLHQANSSGMFVAPTKWLLFQDTRMTRLENSTTANSNDFLVQTFKDLAVFPDSDIIVAQRSKSTFFEIKSIYRPSPYRDVILEERGNWSRTNGLTMKNREAASRRRRDLRLTPLKSCLVMTNPETINHLTDFHDKHVDPVTKANYPWVRYLVERMNATVTFNVTNTWGYRDKNGSWSGMTGMLQRREIDIGGTATFFVAERIGIVKYIQLYTRTGSRFIFRQPLLSAVSNIFTLPFHRSVWLAITFFLLLVSVLLFLSTKWEYRCGASQKSASYWRQMNPGEPTISDNLLVILGAFAQQGYSYEPYRVPSRIVTLMLLIAALSLYASYTANIVALLQSTTDSIKSVADLLESPLKLGAQDVVYNRYYFKSFQDPVRKTVLEQRIEPKGRKSSWMPIEEGVRRIKDELFAFHGEIGTVYKIMQDTFQEEEKCGLTEIDYLNVLYPLLVIQTQSPYLEIIKNGALLLRESGLKFREESRLYTSKPVCHGHTNFISIGFTESYFALVTMAYGTLFAFFVFFVELLWHRRYKHANQEGIEDVTLTITDVSVTSH